MSWQATTITVVVVDGRVRAPRGAVGAPVWTPPTVRTTVGHVAMPAQVAWYAAVGCVPTCSATTLTTVAPVATAAHQASNAVMAFAQLSMDSTTITVEAAGRRALASCARRGIVPTYAYLL